MLAVSGLCQLGGLHLGKHVLHQLPLMVVVMRVQ